MYVAVMKLVFEPESYESSGTWEKDAGAVCVKIRSRFRVLARTCSEADGELAIAVVCLEREEARINSHFEKIMDLCETCGLGRVESTYQVKESLADLAELEDFEGS